MARFIRRENYRDIRCSNALEFLEVLDPVGGEFNSGSFIFRGVNDHKHQLLPSAYRETCWLASPRGYVQGPRRTVLDQCAAEFHTLQNFIDIATRHGIRVPEDSHQLRAALEEWNRRLTFHPFPFQPFEWPPSEFYSVIALAQHYRIATRALDWSWSSYVAAYFAALDAHVGRVKKIVVWVFDDLFRQVELIDQPSQAKRALVTFSASASDNENLRAQQGLFMIQQQNVTSSTERFRPRSYHELLFESLPSFPEDALLVRVLLPAQSATQVLARLSKAGITAGALHPGLWGVAREWDERRMLYREVRRIPESRKAKVVSRGLQKLLDRKGA